MCDASGCYRACGSVCCCVSMWPSAVSVPVIESTDMCVMPAAVREPVVVSAAV